jgi:hypothetical protein
VRDRPTDGSACTPSVRATAFTPAQNNMSTRFAAMGGGGGTHPPLAMLESPPPTVAKLRPRTRARAHTQADADAGADIKHARRRLREGPTNRRQRTHALSARDSIHPGAKQYVNTLLRDGGGTHLTLAVLDRPPPTVA